MNGIIDPRKAANLIESQYGQLGVDCHGEGMDTSFTADALRTVSLALIDIDQHLASIDRSLNHTKDARQ